ncbi:MAG TPA: hypothetical protein PKD32_05525 [Saprospiraceae bacterium]|nr:hypothetical protein [Saprospiraceae bacterium]
MAEILDTYRVGLLVSPITTIADFTTEIENISYEVKFIDKSDSTNLKYCDLVIVSLPPSDLSSLPITFSETHNSPIILNAKHTPQNELEYEKIFTKAFCRFKELNINEEEIKGLIKQEITKSLARENMISDVNIISSKYTRIDFFRNIVKTPIFFFTILPFLFFVIIQSVSFVLSKFGVEWSLICSIKNIFGQYDADCYSDKLENLKLFALLFTLFNLLGYFKYITDVTRKINDDVFQNAKTKNVSGSLYYAAILIWVLSLFTIIVAFLLFIFEFYLFKRNDLSSFNSIINLKSHFLNGNYLIYYFIALDLLLFFYIKQILAVDKKTNYEYHSSKSRSLIKDAKLNFFISICWDIAILINTFFLSYSISNTDNLLIVQLFTLQIVYIYLNLSSSLSQYKHN